jgi:hypothetical protein
MHHLEDCKGCKASQGPPKARPQPPPRTIAATLARGAYGPHRPAAASGRTSLEAAEQLGLLVQDVFSYGLVLWELLTFKMPWDGLATQWQVGRARSDIAVRTVFFAQLGCSICSKSFTAPCLLVLGWGPAVAPPCLLSYYCWYCMSAATPTSTCKLLPRAAVCASIVVNKPRAYCGAGGWTGHGREEASDP